MTSFKVYCIRDFWMENTNTFYTNGVKPGDEYLLWKKGNIYTCKIENGCFMFIQTEVISCNGYPILNGCSSSVFQRYFLTLYELRDLKLKVLLDVI